MASRLVVVGGPRPAQRVPQQDLVRGVEVASADDVVERSRLEGQQHAEVLHTICRQHQSVRTTEAVQLQKGDQVLEACRRPRASVAAGPVHGLKSGSLRALPDALFAPIRKFGALRRCVGLPPRGRGPRRGASGAGGRGEGCRGQARQLRREPPSRRARRRHIQKQHAADAAASRALAPAVAAASAADTTAGGAPATAGGAGGALRGLGRHPAAFQGPPHLAGEIQIVGLKVVLPARGGARARSAAGTRSAQRRQRHGKIAVEIAGARNDGPASRAQSLSLLRRRPPLECRRSQARRRWRWSQPRERAEGGRGEQPSRRGEAPRGRRGGGRGD
mmetsp:Transcript_50479/g.163401  ORF Transcript_50479/g.163401 Transcript_50479/m.163401 type:complete len:333 (-) Transcript_50479:142-1140(-)